MVASAPILAVPILVTPAGWPVYISPPPTHVVVRNRLIERLDEGLTARLRLRAVRDVELIKTQV